MAQYTVSELGLDGCYCVQIFRSRYFACSIFESLAPSAKVCRSQFMFDCDVMVVYDSFFYPYF
jgi:hypothetical protein